MHLVDVDDVDKQSMALADSQFLASVTIRTSGYHVAIIPLYTIVWRHDGNDRLFCRHPGICGPKIYKTPTKTSNISPFFLSFFLSQVSFLLRLLSCLLVFSFLLSFIFFSL